MGKDTLTNNPELKADKYLLVTTTYKNNFTLLELFYKFYKKVWDPTNFLFIVGNTDESKEKNINIINHKLDIKLTILGELEFADHNKSVRNGIVYNYENIFVYMYDTELHYDNNIEWDQIRSFIIQSLHGGFRLGGNTMLLHEYYINVDNDDLLYTVDANDTLENNKNQFHSIEYIPTETFNIKNELKFINCAYYFQLKALNKDIVKNQHTLCRNLDFKDPCGNCHHKMEELHGVIHYETCETFDINNIEQCCYAFGCPSLKSLIEEKHWQQTMINNQEKNICDRMSMTCNVPVNKVKEDFYKYYCYESLSDYEKDNVPIISSTLFRDL